MFKQPFRSQYQWFDRLIKWIKTTIAVKGLVYIRMRIHQSDKGSGHLYELLCTSGNNVDEHLIGRIAVYKGDHNLDQIDVRARI